MPEESVLVVLFPPRTSWQATALILEPLLSHPPTHEILWGSVSKSFDRYQCQFLRPRVKGCKPFSC